MILRFSIRIRILLLVAIALLFALGIALYVVKSRYLEDTLREAERELSTRSLLLETLLETELNSIRKQVRLLTEEPTIKMSVQLQDEATVQDTANQIQSMLNLDYLQILGSSSQVLGLLPPREEALPKELLKAGERAFDEEFVISYVKDGNSVLMGVARAIDFHGLLEGTLFSARRVDLPFLKNLADRSRAEISLFFQEQEILSTRNRAEEEQHWMGQILLFPEGKGEFRLLIEVDQSPRALWLESIQKALLLTGGTCFLLVLLLAFPVIQGLTAPLRKLALAAREIGEGHFHHPVIVRTSSEIGDLAGSLESMRQSLVHYREELIRTEGIRKEMELASNIQMALIPEVLPNGESFELSATLEPAQDVGGDAYFILETEEDSLLLVVADVSGHGIGAALLMAMAQSVLKILAQENPSPGVILYRMNQLLYEELERSEAFISLAVVHYFPHTGKLCYSLAGHPYPFLLRKSGEVDSLKEGGPLLGMIPETDFPEEILALEPGDLLSLYTDGIPEASNEEGQQIGEQGFLELLRSEGDLEEIQQAVYAALQGWKEGLSTKDDRTLVLLKRALDEEKADGGSNGYCSDRETDSTQSAGVSESGGGRT